MRYYVTIGKGDTAERRCVWFETDANGVTVAHVSSFEGEVVEDGRKTFEVDGRRVGAGAALHMLVDAGSHDFAIENGTDGRELVWRGERLAIDVVDERELLARRVAGHAAAGPRDVRASMPGIVVSVEVEVGAEVAAGQTLVVVEAMKMQNPITAEAAGVVCAIHVKPGQAVAAGDALLRLE